MGFQKDTPMMWFYKKKEDTSTKNPRSLSPGGALPVRSQRHAWTYFLEYENTKLSEYKENLNTRIYAVAWTNTF